MSTVMEINSWQAAEAFAADYLKAGGHSDARTTVAGADGGVDVKGARVLAQVKHHGTAVGRPDVQRLFGARGQGAEELYFFSLRGYSPQAIQYAKQHGIGLLSYTSQGHVSAHTAVGRKLTASAVRNAAEADRNRQLAKRAKAEMGPANSLIYGVMLGLAGLGMLCLVGAVFAEHKSVVVLTGLASLTVAGLCFVYLWFAGGVMEVPDD